MEKTLQDTYVRWDLGKTFWYQSKEKLKTFFKVLRDSGSLGFRDEYMSPNFQKKAELLDTSRWMLRVIVQI